MESRTNYHHKTFALRLTLKQRLERTRKWPIHLSLMIFPRMSLHCKLVPGQCRESKYGSFYEYLFTRLRTSLHAVVEPNPNISLDQPSNQIVFRCTGYCHKSGILLYAGFSCPVPSHSLAYIEVTVTFHACPTRKI